VFPLVSRVKDSADKTRKAFQGGFTISAVVLLPVYGLVFALARPITDAILGARWEQLVPLVQILAIDAVVDILADSANPFVMGLGLPQRQALFVAVRTAVIGLAALPLIRWLGVLGQPGHGRLPSPFSSRRRSWSSEELLPARWLASPVFCSVP
jgi:O-antigen/teichoic acid export membrane protein